MRTQILQVIELFFLYTDSISINFEYFIHLNKVILAYFVI